MSLEYDILSEIKPNAEECAEIVADAEELQHITERYLKENDIDAKVMFAGSIGKGTYLKDPDIDMFVMFPEGMDRKEMERLGIQVGMAILNGRKAFAEHPYISGMFKGMEVDMVPCFAVSSADKLKSSVDRTPFHARFILENSDPAMRDEMRLMKKFMKGIGVYGAEPNIRGFSGYLCEILTLYYGGFRNALEAVSKWRPGMRLGFDKGTDDFKGAAMIFYHPVDIHRNVASAVHLDTFARFVTAAKRYLECPDRRFFFPNKRIPFDDNTIRKRFLERGTSLFSVVYDRPDVLDDILHAQMWKTEYAIAKKITHCGFEIIRSAHSVEENRVCFIFELASDELSETCVHTGPFAWVENAGNFLESWKDNPYGAPFISDGMWKVVRKRPYRKAEEVVVKECDQLGAGKDLRSSTMKVYGNDDTLDRMDASILTEILDPRYPWEN